MGNYFWRTEQIELRPLLEKDAEPFWSEDKDSEGKRTLNYGVGLPRSLEGQTKDLPVNFKNAPGRLDFAIENAAGELVGIAAITDIDEGNGTFSTMTFVFAAHRRHGYAEQAKEMMLAYMFGERRFQKYNTSCVETNSAIIAHFLKLGCKEEGRRRRNVFTNGRYHDEILFGLTREEYEEGRIPTATPQQTG